MSENNNKVQNHKKRRRRKKRPPLSRPPVQYPLLCFDSETTHHGELLELSIFDIEGNEIFHQYFRPTAKSWPTDIHHITPEMVADKKRFAAYKNEVSQILNSTDFFVGCALSNDLHTLRRYGIKFQHNINVWDIQNWFWLLHDNSDRVEKQQTGLSAIAARYNLNFTVGHAHSATADTKLTLDCFKALVRDFIIKYQNENDFSATDFNLSDPDNIDEKTLSRLNKCYNAAYMRAMQMFRMRNLTGYINVVRREQGFSLKYTRFEPNNIENLHFSVPVTDRVKAETELREHFFLKQVKGFTGIYNFDDRDFEYIKNYKNKIDLDTFIEREKNKDMEKTPALERACKAISSKTTRKTSPKRTATLAMRVGKRKDD